MTPATELTIAGIRDDVRRQVLAELMPLMNAAARAWASLDAFVLDHPDPGVEALGARYELQHELRRHSMRLPKEVRDQLEFPITGSGEAETKLREHLADQIEESCDCGCATKAAEIVRGERGA
ncbi:hypothetical protein [Microbispora rosea]|uniref:hypothetical protein n=1 Tax=Microbispora rosea TaxID=58117 RepID=UPI0004C313DC|nr:hypothetical protein [Microbispora rosea]